MRSIKPGRGPSMMGGFGAVFSVVFGIFWTVLAASMTRGRRTDRRDHFPLFGVLFIIIGVCNAVYHFKNAAGKNRYSAFDITDEDRGTRPAERAVRRALPPRADARPAADTQFCPYCGAPGAI